MALGGKNEFCGRRSVIDLSVYKRFGFYQLLDPRGPTVRGYHVNRTILKTLLSIIQITVIFGVSGFFVETEDEYEKSEVFEVIAILANCTLSSLKMYTLLRHADLIWNMFELTCADFLQCTQSNAGTSIIIVVNIRVKLFF